MRSRGALDLLARPPRAVGGRPDGGSPAAARPEDRAARWGRIGARLGRLHRGLIGTGVFAGGLWIYARVQELALPQRTLAGSWDAAIPFVPEFVVVYFLFFPFVVGAAFAATRGEWLRIVFASVLAAAVGWLCFLLLPASLSRPDAAGIDAPVSGALLRWLYHIDAPHNTFPSLHVAVTWIACLGFRDMPLFVPLLGAAAAISGSTLFVKQHTLLDVAGGLVLAAICREVAGRVIPRGQASPGGRRPRPPIGRAG